MKEPPSRNTADSSIVPSGTTDTLARRTCLFSVGVPVVPARSLGYLRVCTKALIRNLLECPIGEHLRMVAHRYNVQVSNSQKRSFWESA